MDFWSAHAKISTESLADPKMEEQKLQSVTAPVLPSPKKQYVSNLASRKVNSISIPPIKVYEESGTKGNYDIHKSSLRPCYRYAA